MSEGKSEFQGEKKWWMEAVGYQIYLKSFNDTNGDGIGDIKGVIEKLDYLEYLGVNLLMLTPFYKSPMWDNGYDVSDFYQVDPSYGDVEDVKELLREAHKRDIKVISDLVLNHTSHEHPWFIEARKSKDNPYRDYYIWADGRIDESGREIEPTNWASFFGGSCWEKDELTGQYYMKIFTWQMPDLNWKNEEVRKEIHKIANWWLDLGFDGFRIDAAAHIGRGELVDSDLEGYPYVGDWRKFSNLPVVHDYLKEFHREVLASRDALAIGEVGASPSIEEILDYGALGGGEFNMVFTLYHSHVKDNQKTALVRLKDIFNRQQTGLYGRGWPPLFWLNHDHSRLLNQYGDTSHKYRSPSAKMLATALYFMWGTPFIYNGEEIGMTNYPFRAVEEFDDVWVLNDWEKAQKEGMKEKKFLERVKDSSRDNSRTPMQWDRSENAGFTTGQPWFPINPNYSKINVKAQLEDEDSILHYYREINHLRRHSEYREVIIYGRYQLLDRDNPRVYSYLREYKGQKLLIIANFFARTTRVSFDFEVKKVVLSNYKKLQEGKDFVHQILNTFSSPLSNSENKSLFLKLRPYEAVVLEVV